MHAYALGWTCVLVASSRSYDLCGGTSLELPFPAILFCCWQSASGSGVKQYERGRKRREDEELTTCRWKLLAGKMWRLMDKHGCLSYRSLLARCGQSHWCPSSSPISPCFLFATLACGSSALFVLLEFAFFAAYPQTGPQ